MMNPHNEQMAWINDALIVSYFLGRLSEEESARLEDLCFEDEAVAERVFAIESELIDDYLRGALPPEERRLFECNYLVTDQRLERLEFAAAFRRQVLPGGPPPETVRFERFAWLRSLTPPRWAFAMVLFAVVSIGISLLVSRRGQPEPADLALTPSPSSNQTATPATVTPGSPRLLPTLRPISPPPRTTIAAITLLPGGVKSADQDDHVLSLPRDAAFAELRLVFAADEYAAYRARVQNRLGKTIWSGRNQQPIPRPDGLPEIRLRIPAGRFRSGNYSIQLLGTEKTRPAALVPLGEYILRIEVN
jgi:anti-sigma-K factor RskA